MRTASGPAGGSRAAPGAIGTAAPPGAADDAPARSDRLCDAALRAYARLYRALDHDEPDVSANVSYAVCRTALERRARATAWTLPADRATHLRGLLRRVEETTDRRTLAAWFQGFPDQVLADLERRTAPRAASTGGRRASDRAAAESLVARLV